MRRSLILMSALLSLVPMLPALAGPTVVHVYYLGLGQFEYKKTVYSYTDLVTKIQSDYSGEQIDQVMVGMGTVAGQMDKTEVCQLRQSLQAPVLMKLKTDTGNQDLYCN